jgi:hypothetical protein
MSLAQDYLDRLLKLDVESYLRGKAPGALALRAAPLLEDWRIERVCEPTDGPSSVRLENATVDHRPHRTCRRRARHHGKAHPARPSRPMGENRERPLPARPARQRRRRPAMRCTSEPAES